MRNSLRGMKATPSMIWLPWWLSVTTPLCMEKYIHKKFPHESFLGLVRLVSRVGFICHTSSTYFRSVPESFFPIHLTRERWFMFIWRTLSTLPPTQLACNRRGSAAVSTGLHMPLIVIWMYARQRSCPWTDSTLLGSGHRPAEASGVGRVVIQAQWGPLTERFNRLSLEILHAMRKYSVESRHNYNWVQKYN
jgi:hypothetical protein